MHRRSFASEGRFVEDEPEGRASVCETQSFLELLVATMGGHDSPNW